MRPADLRTVLGVPYTDEQLAAAAAPLEPGVIVAGAGSGKTSVMAARVVWLVATGAVAPDDVLGLTFTNKAAAELAGRVRSALARAGLSTAVTSSAPYGPARHVTAAGSGPDSAEATGEPTISTYHAFAGRLVAEHGLRIGVEPRARLLADATRFQLAGRVLRRHGGPVEALTHPMVMLVGELVALESELSEHLVSPERLVEADSRWLAEARAALAVEAARPRNKGHTKEVAKLVAAAVQRLELAALAADYRAAKTGLESVDFGDQVRLAATLAAQPEVGALERSRAAVVLLDEYQDTSVAQRVMLTGLFGGGHPVTAVGDPSQAIYGWRGASVSNLDGFPEHFPRRDSTPSAVYELSVNQRSGGRLLRLANGLAASLRARHRVVELRPRPEVAERGETVVALHETWEDEVGWVAARLAAAVRDGTRPGECAVLVRTHKDVPALHAALVSAGVPVEVVGLGGLLTLPEVEDVVSVLEVLDEPTANGALLRLLTGPRWRIGARDLAALGRRARDLAQAEGSRPDRGARADGTADAARTDIADAGAAAGAVAAGGVAAGPVGDCDGAAVNAVAGDVAAEDVSDRVLEEAVAGVDPCDLVALSDALGSPGPDVSPEAGVRFAALHAELRSLRAHVDEPLLDLCHRVVATTGLDVELSASPEVVAAGRRDTLARFLDVAGEFLDLDGESSLTAFLAFLRAAEEYERGLDSSTPSGSDAVQLMTAHKAKGLEWDVVALPDMTRDVFPATKLRGKWPGTASVLPTPLRGDAPSLPALTGYTKKDLAEFEQECRDHQLREERRLGYVAVTRARHLLLASAHWWGPTQKKPRGPSMFLDELRQHCQPAAATGTPVAGTSDAGTPAAGTPATGTPAAGTPAAGTPATGTPATGTPAVGTSAAGTSAAGTSAAGTVDCWAPTPADGAKNPLLAQAARYAWPAGIDEMAQSARLEAAAGVHAAARLLAGSGGADGSGGPEGSGVADGTGGPGGRGRPGGTGGTGGAGGPTAYPPAREQAALRDDLAGMSEAERALLRDLDRDGALLVEESLRDRRPVRDVALPRTLTASQVVRLGSDPDGLARELARPLPRRPVAAARRGTRFHGWVEDLFRLRPLLDDDDLPGAQDAGLGEDGDLAALQEAFLTSAYARRPPHLVEAPFALSLAGRVVRGRIDAVYDLGGGRWEVVDWKTGTEPSDPLQLAVYRLAWAELAGVAPEQVDAAFLTVRTGEVVRPRLAGVAELDALLRHPHGVAAVTAAPAQEALF